MLLNKSLLLLHPKKREGKSGGDFASRFRAAMQRQAEEAKKTQVVTTTTTTTRTGSGSVTETKTVTTAVKRSAPSTASEPPSKKSKSSKDSERKG